jgi:hypothetical protein
MVDSSRANTPISEALGVSVASFLDQLPGLAERNATHHRTNRTSPSWDLAAEQERQQEAMRSGAWASLPIVEPLAPLVWDPEDNSPSDLLRPRHAVVPLLGRQDSAQLLR